MGLHAPVPLQPDHIVTGFSCGEESMDAWLRQHALRNQESGASRTFVVTTDDSCVVGYYSLAAGHLVAIDAVGRFRRNMPDPLPVVVLGRLAVDIRFQHRGLSRAMVRDALLRTIAAAEQLGIRGVIVHALRNELIDYYRKLGFTSSPTTPDLLMITLKDAQAALSSPH